MTSRRMAKASEAIRETVSSTILFELRDPRVKNVTVLSAEAAPDLKTAKVYVSVMGTPKEQSLCMHGLESARGYIQSKLADRLQTRYTPVLRFVLDPAVKKSIEASRAIREALASDRPASESESESFADDDWDDDQPLEDQLEDEEPFPEEDAQARESSTPRASDSAPDDDDL